MNEIPYAVGWLNSVVKYHNLISAMYISHVFRYKIKRKGVDLEALKNKMMQCIIILEDWYVQTNEIYFVNENLVGATIFVLNNYCKKS